MRQYFASSGQSIGVSASASVFPMNTQDWSPLGWTGWISLQSKGLSRVFSNTTVQKHQLFGTQFSSPGSLDAKESGDNVRDPGLIPVSGRSPREGNGYPLSYACLENSTDRGAWWAMVYEVKKSQTWQCLRLSVFTFTSYRPCIQIWSHWGFWPQNTNFERTYTFST